HGAVEVGSELVTFVCYAPGGRSLAIGKRGRVEIWEIASRTRRAAFTGFDGEVNMVQFSADGRQLAAATNGRHAYVLDLATRKQAHQRLGQAHASGFRDQGEVNLVHIFPDGKVASVASADDVLLLGEFPR